MRGTCHNFQYLTVGRLQRWIVENHSRGSELCWSHRTDSESRWKTIAPSNGGNTSCWKMNLLSHTDNVIVIPCLKEHLLYKMPCLSCQEPNHPFQARNYRESTRCPQLKCDNITKLQPTDWPDSTKRYCHIYILHYFRVWAVEPVCNFPPIKPVVPKNHKHKARQRQMVKHIGSKILFYKFRTLEIMASTQFFFIR